MSIGFSLPKRVALAASLSVVASWGVSVNLQAADPAKTKVLDKFERIDEKTLKAIEAQLKVVSTKDKDHPKALEVKMDFARPGSYPGFTKTFPEATLNPTKYEAFRFWVRSDVGTSFSVDVSGVYKRKDGKGSGFFGGGVKGEPEWKQVTIPFRAFKRHAGTFYKDGQRIVQPGGGEPLDEEDYGGTTRISFRTAVENRGTSVIGQLMFDNLELVEKQK
jgi:hypothetical protein